MCGFVWLWLLSLNIMYIRSNYVVACIRTPFFLLLNTLVYCTDTQHFIYLLVSSHSKQNKQKTLKSTRHLLTSQFFDFLYLPSKVNFIFWPQRLLFVLTWVAFWSTYLATGANLWIVFGRRESEQVIHSTEVPLTRLEGVVQGLLKPA